jgi:hypothetical protein
MRAFAIALAACSFTPVPSHSTTDGPVVQPDASLVDTPDAAPVTSCPSTYTSISTLTSKYRVDTTVLEWAEAEAACEADGAAHLAVLTDMTEELTLAGTTGVQTWIGIDDRIADGVFRAVTTEVPDLPWMAGQPKSDASKRCVVLHDDGTNVGKIDPHACTDTHPYVCECDFLRADPSAF